MNKYNQERLNLLLANKSNSDNWTGLKWYMVLRSHWTNKELSVDEIWQLLRKVKEDG